MHELFECEIYSDFLYNCHAKLVSVSQDDNYALFNKWNEEEIYFVTRLKNNAKEVLLEEFDLPKATPDEILRDVKIALKYKGKNGSQKQVKLGLVSFYLKEKTRYIIFLLICSNYPQNRFQCCTKNVGK